MFSENVYVYTNLVFLRFRKLELVSWVLDDKGIKILE